MSLPKNIVLALREIDIRLDETVCEGAIYHSPSPLVVDLLPLADPDCWPEDIDPDLVASAPQARLCGTCRVNVALLLNLLHANDGDVAWAVRREFGNHTRALAMKGWEWFVDQRPAPSDAPAT